MHWAWADHLRTARRLTARRRGRRPPGCEQWRRMADVSAAAQARRNTGAASQVEEATLRYLLYGVLPAWFVPGVLDWLQHRRTRIERTAGVRESLIHLLMMAEIGVPITLALLAEISPLTLLVMFAALAGHEATALWDVRTAESSGRQVRPIEQHIHSFLEMLPFMALSGVGCLHGDEVRALVFGPRRDFRLRRKRRPLPARYVAAVGAGVAGLIAVPYLEELVRCIRVAVQERSTHRADVPAEHPAGTPTV